METVAPFIEVIDEIKEAGGEIVKMCFQCGMCDAVCPWNRVRQFSMRKLIREAAFGLSEVEGEDIWRCTTCGTCPQQCPRGVKQIDVSVSLRRVAAEYELFPTSVRSARTARASIISEGNPLQGERGKRAEWAQGLPVKTYTEEMEVLTAYDWLGNVRELENVIERAMILSPGPSLVVADLMDEPRRRRDETHEVANLQGITRAHIIKVLGECDWKIKGSGNAADRLGMPPSTVRSRMQKLGIARPKR